MELPKMAMVEQYFDPQRIDDIPAEIAREIAGLSLQQKIKQGDTVAITAGSRGIVNIDMITKVVVDELRKRGTQPFIFPAMGSHGGATVEGQLKFWKNTE